MILSKIIMRTSFCKRVYSNSKFKLVKYLKLKAKRVKTCIYYICFFLFFLQVANIAKFYHLPNLFMFLCGIFIIVVNTWSNKLTFFYNRISLTFVYNLEYQNQSF